MADQPLIWVLTDDRAGHAAQALGVAEALDRPFVTKTIRYTPLARLPNMIVGVRLVGLTPESRMDLVPPWPDLVIAAGRRTAPAARWIKSAAARGEGKSLLLVQLMHPGRAGADEFDLIAVPHHDGPVRGGDAANVLRTTGAAHRLNSARLRSAADSWAARVSGLPRPFIALMVGGATHRRPFPARLASDLGREVHRIAAARGGSVLLASSRRTGRAAEEALIATIPEPRRVFLWSGGGDNPYFGFLGLADVVVVTGDSVSMCSEACATPGPVYIYAPEGVTVAKHERLHRQLYDLGVARPFETLIKEKPPGDWRHPPLNPAGDIARAVNELIHKRLATD